MSIQYQSTSSLESIKTSEKKQKKYKKKQTKKTESIDQSKSKISEKSGSETSIKEKIVCYLLCCCYHGKSP